ncbi:hypothetical protein CEK25_000051 [Fusarium fujikuroi]|nr:hypothetical protein CEK25_000051 [Fusarium fujikuroi]
MDADAQTQPTLPDNDGPSRRRRVRDFRRGYHACELCRKKKIRCIVDKPGASCLRCQREVKECVFSDERSHRKRNKTVDRRGSSEQAADSEHGITMASTSSAQANMSQDTFTEEPSQMLDDSNDLTFPGMSISVRSGLPDHQQQAVMNEASPSISSTGPAGEITTTLVSNGNDALRLLYQPAIEHANKDGASPSNQGPMTRHTQHPTAGTSSPRTTASVIASGPNLTSPISLSPLTVWRAFRFVRMGWFTAEEAVNYVDLFRQNLAPLSPVSRGFDLSHEKHYKLITQEPLLCCVILMISSRYHVLSGHGGLARSTIVHHRLWEHCQHLVMRIIFGQEKRSKAKTRTRGSIEALLLIIEWHPQAIHLPPASDGWDSSTLLTDFDPRDDQFDNQADTTDDNEAQWLRDVILPAKTSDRMSWMLLGCVQSLALELGLCDDGERGDTSTKPPGFKAEQTRLRDLLYIFLEQQSSRLGCPSMMPTSVSRFMSESSRRDVQGDSAIVAAWLDLTNLTRTIIDVLCPSATGIRDILSSSRYVNIIKHFQKQLAGWKTTHLSHENLCSHAYEDLTIEYNYLRAFMNSFGIQAAVDRVLGRGPPNFIDTDVLQSSITATDYSFIKEVIDSSCQALESVSRLFEAGKLRYCPVRVFLRIIMVSIFLLKALSLGIRTTDLETSLGILERSIRALRDSNLDEMHLASRYGELLDMHLEKYRQSLVPTTIPQGIRAVDQTSQWTFDTSVPPVDDSLGDLSMPAVDDWLALPFDPSMAPFGFATDDPDVAEPEDRHHSSGRIKVPQADPRRTISPKRPVMYMPVYRFQSRVRNVAQRPLSESSRLNLLSEGVASTVMSNYPNYYPPPGHPAGAKTYHPSPMDPPYYEAPPHAPPPGYQQPIYPPQPGSSGIQGPPNYYTRVGFTRLPAKFHIWNVVTSSGASCLELGPQLKGPLAYSAKMFSSNRLKIKEGPYASENLPICTIESRHMFSSKSTITFDGFQANFVETSVFNDGATWPFDVEVNGSSQGWQWRRKKTQKQSTVGQIVEAFSDSDFGSWELVPGLGQSWPMATFEATGGNTFEDNAALGVFEFHGPAAIGQLGDIFVNVSIAILLRIISQHYISRIAALAGS